MFNKVLIANRGEIAVRIIRACHQLKINTVAVYSTADKEAMHVQMADEAICIGGSKVSDSYLNMENIISAAIVSGAEAIHPGYGFLSENSNFARLCRECGIVFIGASPEIIELMGNKSKARETMEKASVPTVPGSTGSVKSYEEAYRVVQKIGCPVLIKATNGGGGKGMRIVRNVSELEVSLNAAKMEALNAFGDDDVYIEKFVENPKHIEVQIIGDSHGNIVHLGDRDCSIQRRNQKMIEEAPAFKLNPELAKRMHKAAVKAANFVKYVGVGTIEFVFSSENKFYFIEMNTRLQVEHPVTEFITSIDIVKEQIKIAAGRALSFKQRDIIFSGHSIECRLLAEDPENDFRPSPGRVTVLNLPGGNGVRVDTAIYHDYVIPSNYDSMLGKVITHGKDRSEAIAKMKQALQETLIGNIKNNTDFLYSIIDHPEFKNGSYRTSFIQNRFGKRAKK